MANLNDKIKIRIYITGTPGTGKTSVAECLAHELNMDYMEINDMVVQEGLFLGYDINRDTLIIDDELLGERLTQKLHSVDGVCVAGGVVISNLPFDLIIILHSLIPTLRNRLKGRGYSEEKIESNMEAEIMNVLYYELNEIYGADKIFEFTNDNQTIEETCKQIISVIREHHLGVSK